MATVIINGTSITEQEISVLKVALDSLEMEITEPSDSAETDTETDTETETGKEVDAEKEDDVGLTDAYLKPIYRMQMLLQD